MPKVAFWYPFPTDYSGGLNYFRNLLSALSSVGNNSIESYIFFAENTPMEIIEDFRKYGVVQKTSLLDEWSFLWILQKLAFRIFKSAFLVNALFKGYGVKIAFSSSFNLCAKDRGYRLMNWIPDFQYLHLPELFPGVVPALRTARMCELIVGSDIVIVSSQAAFRDFKSIAPEGNEQKGRVLHFVSQPAHTKWDTLPSLADLESKLGFTGKFFFLPNQFWRHKNHMVVFEAVNLLKKQGISPLVLCSGSLMDVRFPQNEYVNNLLLFISKNKLDDNIKILGKIEYVEVLSLMRGSLAVINPSLFEGWSSSVEEAKSMGKRVILSDIDVHVEQAPIGGHFFKADDFTALAKLMRVIWEESNVNTSRMQDDARVELRARTEQFAREFLKIVHELVPE